MSTSTTVRTAQAGVRRPVRPVRHAGRGTRPAACAAVARAPRPAVQRPEAAEPAPQPGTHLTGRGRAVVLVVLVALLLAAFSLGRTVAEGSTEVQPRPQVEQVTVLPGDTLWAVAQRLAPGQDPRPVVEQIRQLNDLSGGGLQAGQQLLLPVSR